MLPKRSTILAVGMLTLAAGCESSIFIYDCRGTVLDDAGRPVVGAPVHVEPSADGQPRNFWYGDRPVDDWDNPNAPAARTDAAGQFRAEVIGGVYTRWWLPFASAPVPPVLANVRVWFGRGDGWWVPALPTALVPTDQSRIGGANGREDADNIRHVDLPQPVVMPPPTAPAMRSPDWHALAK
jgi:hypothetical protein